MRRLLTGLLAGGLLLALAPAATFAQESWDDEWDGPIPARVRHFEGSVTVQRAHAGETGEALINLPLDPGDRLWTGDDGRVEVVLGDGTLLWLDRRTTLDFVSLPRSGRSEMLVRVWSGSVIVARDDTYDDLRIDAPEAQILLRSEVLARIDAESGRSWLSVLRGQGQIQAGGLVEVVYAGSRSFAESGTAPAEAIVFNTAERDAFDGWYAERLAATARSVEHVRRERRYVPREIVHYAADLEPHGNWVYYDDFDAWAWRPRATVSWAPYRQGRWVYAYGGWTWVDYSPWGWVTSHYGRWHHAPAYGWVWFPGRVYSPGWVSWYVGGGYVGWCPIGFYNRPLISVNLFLGGHGGYGYGYHGNTRGYAVPRGTAVAGRGYTQGLDGGWTFVRDGEIGRPDLSRRVVTDRVAVRRTAQSGSVTLQGPLRPRDPSALVVGSGGGSRTATPRPGVFTQGSSTQSRVAVGRTGSATGSGDGPAVRPGVAGIRPQAGGDPPRTAVIRPGTGASPTPRPSVQGRPDGGDTRIVVPRPSEGASGLRPQPSVRPGERPGVSPRPSPRPGEGASIAPRPGGRPAESGSIAPRPTARPGGGYSRGAPSGPPRSGIAVPRGGAPSPRAGSVPSRPGSGSGGAIARPRSGSGTGLLRPRSAGSSGGPTVRPTPGGRPGSSSGAVGRGSARLPARPSGGLSRGSARPTRPAPAPSSARKPVRRAKPKPKKPGGGSGTE